MIDPAAVWVTLGGVALAVGVNLYFFSPRRAAIAEVAPPPLPPPAADAPAAAPEPPAPAPEDDSAPLPGA